MSTLQVENLIGQTSGSNANKIIIPSGQTLDASNGFVAPAGHVIQVVQNIGSAVTTNSTTPTTVASASITIQSTSKVYAACVGDMNNTGTSAWNYYRIYRDSTAVSQTYIGQAGQTSHNLPFSIFYLDHPSSSGTYTYTLKCWQGSGSMQFGENGSVQAPTMILMEIAQ
jgi:hypothetical protein